MLILDAPRLSLLALDVELAGLQASSRTAFFNALAVMHNAVWPPEPFGEAALVWSRENLARDAEGVGWYGWTLLANEGESAPPHLIGSAALIGRPDEDGDVELAFGLLPAYRGRGYGVEAVRALATWALKNGAKRVIVHLDAEDNFAVRTLQKTGFFDTREPPYPGVARWALAA
ncbi:MAG TPA: GNAT family N-acetyltransferase [Caulobacterales bacterium]|nr:GNAT family N-acetyltransferase [Caulobacterales bacterium]